MQKEIESIDDIQLLVNSFYDKVRQDHILAPVFNETIKEWPPHLDKMYRFWQSILLDQHTYNGAPFPKHAVLSIGEEHFHRWLTLFHETVDSLFSGKKAQEAKFRANRIADVFQIKLGIASKEKRNK
jgi:hemoglobin